MIKVFSSKDYKNFQANKSLEKILHNILSSSDYLEFSDGSSLILGMRNQNSREVICATDTDYGDFLRKVRDNYKFVASQYTRKNILQKIYDNQENLNSIFKRLISMRIKTQLQLKSFLKKIELLSQRLQNVFVISEDLSKTARTFDHADTVIVIPSFDDKYHDIINQIKESPVVLFVSEEKIPYKKLKQMGLSNLSYKKESTKYIWTKNLNINEYIS